MGAAGVASYFILVATAGLLFYIAATDLREFTIRNDALLVLTALFFIYAALSGRWVELHWNVGFAAVTFAMMLFCYSRGLMGGGDVKLLTVAFLWTGTHCVLPFLIVLMIFASLHGLAARLDWVRAQRVNGHTKVAFAPSIAAGLIAIFVSGCLTPL